jgi:hypothetical protein
MAGLFFDTSALAKLYHAEAGSAMVEGLVLRSGSVILISRLGVVEAGSVFAMKARSCVITTGAAVSFRVVALTSHHYAGAGELIQ